MVGLPDIGAMNTNIHSDRMLAETLKALTIEPQGFKVAARPNWLVRAGIPVAVLAACGAGYALIWHGPDLDAGLLRNPVQETTQPAAAPALAEPVMVASTHVGPANTGPAAAALPAGQEITGSGYVVASQQTTVFARYGGDVIAVEVNLGDRVEKGQVLLRLDDPDARFALQKAGIALRSAELALAARQIDQTVAEAALQRDTRLGDSGALSRQRVIDSQNARDVAANAVEQATATLASTKVGLGQAQSVVDNLVIHAPIGGVVTELPVRVGNSILSRSDSTRGDGDLMTITDTDSMVIEADVAETNIGRLRPGLKGQAVLDGFPNTPFAIRIERIAPTISVEKGTVALRFALIDPPAGIRPNMAASINFSDLPEPAQDTQQGTQP